MLQSSTSPECMVFVVDDDDGVREALELLLQGEGFAVRTYSSARGVLGETQVPNNSCLVTDYHMPGMDGLALVDALRTRGNSIPAILMTGDLTQRVRDRAAAAHVPVIAKLTSADGLVERIKEMIKARIN